MKERELMSKRLGKYIAYFEYFDKSLFASFVKSGSISIASFLTVIGAPVGIISANFSLTFSISTRIIKVLLKITQEIKRKNTI